MTGWAKALHNRKGPLQRDERLRAGGFFPERTAQSALSLQRNLRISPREVMAWFEARGCALKTERGNRVFPQSDKSASVIDALRAELRRLGVRVLQERALDIVTQDGAVCGIETDGGFHKTERVILATGGCSYPQTGSTGDGYRMLEKLGHTIVPPVGSLVPLVEKGYRLQADAGGWR